jgi:hypothetical protein
MRVGWGAMADGGAVGPCQKGGRSRVRFTNVGRQDGLDTQYTQARQRRWATGTKECSSDNECGDKECIDSMHNLQVAVYQYTQAVQVRCGAGMVLCRSSRDESCAMGRISMSVTRICTMGSKSRYRGQGRAFEKVG